MSEPLVTVGISFYNCEKTLLAAIKSIFAQTLQDWELILIDGGSSDKSLEIAKSIKDPRVRVISDGHYHNHPAALNQLIDLARGQYIARMDGDDLCSPKRLEKQLELFKKDESLDVVGTGITYLDDMDFPLGYSTSSSSHSEICAQPYRTFHLCHGSIMAKRSWYLKNKYDESAVKVEDFDLWLRSYEHSKFSNVCEALYYYRCEAFFSQKKLFIARINSIRILFRYYKKKNIAKAIWYSALQITKMVVGPIICLFKSDRGLIRKRYNPFNDSQEKIYVEELNYIKNIKLPLKD
ncbi:MAG: glycosyltransferase family 2 protein [Sedimentisphaerales bacterium]